MMNNLFSIFDTATNSMLEMNWISSMSNLMMIPPIYWFFFSKLNLLLNKFNLILLKEFKVILFSKFNLMNSIFLISLMMMILLNNMMGLLPYVFTSSSHMIFSMSISMPMWLSLMMFGWSKNTNYMFSHMIPHGTPMTLMPFMVLIETISNIIRPMTLMIRLTANMIAGHLLLTLLSQMAMMTNWSLSTLIIIAQIILLILEFSVSIIQAYVFIILTTLYLKETN